MRSPHTHFVKGKRVAVMMKDGSQVIGRFIQRRSRSVVLDCATIEIRHVQNIGPYGVGRKLRERQ